jgi:hypothetical protein
MEKGPPETPVKFWSRSNGRIKSYGTFEPLILPAATRPPHQRVSIPHPLYWKGPPETPVKFRSRSNGRINSYSFTNHYSCLARPNVLLTEYRFHIHYMQRASGNSGKILIAIQRSHQKLWPLRIVSLAWRDQISYSNSIDSTSTIWKRASGNSCKI